MRVLVTINVNSEAAREAARSLRVRLVDDGHTPVMTLEDAAAVSEPDVGADRASLGVFDLIVALGGDGTILKAVHLSGDSDAPILGVNLGRLGFMAGATASTMFEAVHAALNGSTVIEERSMLQATLQVGGREVGSHLALNEVYVGRSTPHRVVEVYLDVNGTRLSSFYCDGVIIATPTGSTAYALSFGGPLVSPGVEALILVPAGAHTLQARPVVLAPEDVLDVTFPNLNRADACVSVDGEMLPCRSSLERVSVRMAARRVRLARFDGRVFYDALRDSFLKG